MNIKAYSSRYLEIINILRKHSLLKKYNKLKNADYSEADHQLYDDLASDFGISLRTCFEEIGPTFVKFGQMLSTMSEILPKKVIEELQKLQDEVKAFSGEEAISLIEESYARDMGEIFAAFDRKPIAQGSIAQVHKAYLLNGKKVAVKVQRPEIKSIIIRDTAILEQLAKSFNKFIKINEIVKLLDLVDEFKDQIFKEIDFTQEAQNMIDFSDDIKRDRYVFTPYLYRDYINDKVIIMDFIEAKSIKSLSEEVIEEHGEQLAKRLIYSFTRQVFEQGFFHADPHPGNILVNDQLDLFLTDFGIVGRLTDRKKYTLLKLFMGISINSTRVILASLIELGAISSDVNSKAFEFEIRQFLDRYMRMSLKEIKIADIFNDFIKLLYKYDIRIDRSLLAVGKTVLILEGVIEFLDRKSSLIELSRPIAKKLFKRFISVDYLKNYLIDSSVDMMELLVTTPKTLLDISRKLDENSYVLQVHKLEDDRLVQLEIEKIRQNQRNIILISSIILFMVSLLVLSLAREISYRFLWVIILMASAGSVLIVGVYSLVKYIRYDKNKEIRNKKQS
ncbi:MAG: AarF/UbiB family protein [Tissierellia bacterium]|nr:AarF/UbiB family protein [Tissierellia bacterium]